MKATGQWLFATILLLSFAFYGNAAEPDVTAESQQKAILKWLGNAGWEIRLGKTIILIDPFLTRKDRSMAAKWKTDEEAVLKVIKGADYIFAGHSDQEISFGEPKPVHREMFKAVVSIREAVLGRVKDGATQRDLIDAYQKACKETGFKSSPHSQIHQYGIDVPEFPGMSYRIADPNPDAGGMGGAGNYVLKTGMIYSISPTVVGKEGKDSLLGGTSLVVTETGYRDHGERKVAMLVVS